MAVRSSSTDGNGSSSTISAETATGWHVLNVEGYSQTKGVLGVGNFVKSGAFTAGGHTWCVRYYPDGYDEESAGCTICFDLFLEDADPADNDVVKVKHSFSLLDKAGDPVPRYKSTCDVCALSSATPSWGYHWIAVTEELESSPPLGDDSFTIRCDVTVIKAIRAKTTTTAKPHVPALLERDVVIEVGGERYMAHRCVLAAHSPVLRPMLFGPAVDAAGVAHLRIHNMEAEVFEDVLYFVYTGALPEKGEDDKAQMANLLLAAAERFDLQGLKQACEDMLMEYIDESSVVYMLELAKQYGCHGLQEACYKFLDTPIQVYEDYYTVK